MMGKFRILFLRELPALAASLRRLDSVILSPGATKNDLNLLFLFSGGAPPDADVKQIAGTLETEIESQFSEKIRINPVSRRLPDLDKYFLAQILREGQVVYGESSAVSSGGLNLRPMTLISFSLRDKPQKEKTRLNYLLYGRKLKSGGKEKSIDGRLGRLGGSRPGAGVLLVPERAREEITEILKREKVSYSERGVWTNAEEKS